MKSASPKLRQADMVAQIERALATRSINQANRLIKAYLRRSGSSRSRWGEPENHACEWYRRLGFFEEGLRLADLARLNWHPRGPQSPAPSANTVRRLVWGARFLNSLGVTTVAASLLRSLPLQSAQDHRIAGSIYLANFEFTQARHHYEQMMAHDPEPQSYASRVAALSAADAWAGLGDFERAKREANRIATISPEPILKGICLQAQGEYLAQEGRFEESLQRLESALTHFPDPKDQGRDLGFLRKWLGYAHAQLGELDRGAAQFDQAWKILRRLGGRPETWLDIIRLKQIAGLASAGEIRTLHAYPGLADGFKKTLAGLPSSRPDAPALRRPDSAKISIALDSQEYRIGRQRHLGLSTELKLLGLVSLTHPFGLSVERAKTLLWPDDIFSFPFLQARLDQLLHRIRTRHRITLEVRDRILSISPHSAAQIEVRDQTGDQPDFLRDPSRAHFTTAELDEYYGLSRAQRHRVIVDWVAGKRIIKTGRGKALRLIRL